MKISLSAAGLAGLAYLIAVSGSPPPGHLALWMFCSAVVLGLVGSIRALFSRGTPDLRVLAFAIGLVPGMAGIHLVMGFLRFLSEAN